MRLGMVENGAADTFGAVLADEVRAFAVLFDVASELRARLPLENAESMLDSLLGGRIGVRFAPPQPDRKLILACTMTGTRLSRLS